MTIVLSTLKKPLTGPTSGMVIGQTKLMRIPGNPSVVSGLHFGLAEGSIQLVKRDVEHVITDMRFIKFIYGDDTLLTSVTLPIVTGIPFLIKPTYTAAIDPRDGFYTRIF